MSADTQEHAGSIELNGINVISEDERGGKPRQLFWPWFAANISVLGLSYGSFVLGFGISFWQATVAGLIGIVVSFLGVVVALVIAFAGWLIAGRRTVRSQEATPAADVTAGVARG